MIKEKPVVVHANNAIFFGYLVSEAGAQVKLRSARNAYYWKCSEGILELSSKGPQLGSKIGARSGGIITIENKVLMQECSKEATEAWEERGWGN